MRRLALIAALVAHVCAWAAFLFLLFWPTYSGSSVSAVAVNIAGDLPSRAPLTLVEPEVTRETFSATIIDVNGLRVVPILALPLALTAAAAMAVVLLPTRPRFGLRLMWTSTIAAALFSMLALFSIGLFYFPAVLALILASIIASIGEVNKASSNPSA